MKNLSKWRYFRFSAGACISMWRSLLNVCSISSWPTMAVLKIRKNIYRSDVQSTLSFTVILAVYRSFIPNHTAFTKYFLTQWISKLRGNSEIHWVNFTGLAGIENAFFLQDRANFHRSRAWQIVLIFNTAMVSWLDDLSFAHNINAVYHLELLGPPGEVYLVAIRFNHCKSFDWG